MSEIMLKHEEIDRIFKSHLKIESKVISIESLFTDERLKSKIDYKPYFQRNYVWDKDKATYFIESILLGTEVPPLVFFNNYKKIEIIDGRQRYETIKNFIDKEFSLTSQGLHTLKYLNKKNFDDLDIETQNIFYDTKLRILEFSVVNEPKLTDKKEDLIKKEIFRRYNSGITPLKKSEIEKAVYIDDEISSFFRKTIKNNRDDYTKILQLLFSERDFELIDKKDTIDKVMTKIRQMLVLSNIPIKRFSSLPNRNDILSRFYDILSDNVDDAESFYEDFMRYIGINWNLSDILENKESHIYNNRLIYECTFWVLTILNKEISDYTELIDNAFLEEYAEYLIKNADKFSIQNSLFYKNVNDRYSTVAEFFENKLDLNLRIYIDDYSVFKSKVEQSLVQVEDINKTIRLENVRLNKPEPVSETIDNICRLMDRNKFLVRPIYQRLEVMNKIKASALIESIILGIKLPPIFLYKRNDGIHEVIDGQQRLLAILGFIGREFVNEEGKRVKSEKNKFKLTKLRILEELNDKGYEELDQEQKDKILDFNLFVVTIDSKINPEFDQIDLFIRLNNKPYPIKENSFEMWNSYIDKDIISQIKENAKKHSQWFHLVTEQKNSRMDNEELYTSLAYLEYEKQIDTSKNNCLNIYQREENVYVRLKSKLDITKVLNNVTIYEKEKNKFLSSIENVETFIQKIKTILVDKDFESNEFLKNSLNQLFYSKSTKRNTQNFYSLWLILSDISLEAIIKNRVNIRNDVRAIFHSMKSIVPGIDGAKNFTEMLVKLKDKYMDT